MPQFIRYDALVCRYVLHKSFSFRCVLAFLLASLSVRPFVR